MKITARLLAVLALLLALSPVPAFAQHAYERHCGVDYDHRSHKYHSKISHHDHLCPGGPSGHNHGGGGGRRREQLTTRHCGTDYNHRAHTYYSRGANHGHYCPGGPSGHHHH